MWLCVDMLIVMWNRMWLIGILIYCYISILIYWYISILLFMKDKLIIKNYIEILVVNFLLFFGFWLLMFVLFFYLVEVFDVNKIIIGVVFFCYIIVVLCICFFFGYLLDIFVCKLFYLLVYFIFIVIFGGYFIVGILILFILFCIIYGVLFGMVIVSGNIIVIDIMFFLCCGEGLGYYGLVNNIVMFIGLMIGFFLYDVGVDYMFIFCCLLGFCLIGFLCVLLVKIIYKFFVKWELILLDCFILFKGILVGFSLLLLFIFYGMIINYVVMYVK